MKLNKRGSSFFDKESKVQFWSPFGNFKWERVETLLSKLGPNWSMLGIDQYYELKEDERSPEIGYYTFAQGDEEVKIFYQAGRPGDYYFPFHPKEYGGNVVFIHQGKFKVTKEWEDSILGPFFCLTFHSFIF